VAVEVREIVAALAAVATRRSPPGAAEWLRAQLGVRDAFDTAFAAAGRRLGKMPITAADAADVLAAGLRIPAGAGTDECGRGALLSAIEPSVELVRDLVRRGESRERQAVLRVLSALHAPERFVEIVVDACRTNIEGVFRAIACDNAYPAAQFSDPAFAQLVLKALFTGAPLARLVGLAERTTPELVRMVEAYASERRAAGRAVPEDAKLVTGP
jgi:hypothetical protein